MISGTIETFCAELSKSLGVNLSKDDVDEIVSEARNHLGERAEELVAGGVSVSEADCRAVSEFGGVGEIALEMMKLYPPQPPLDPKRVRWLPEIAIVVQLAIMAWLMKTNGVVQSLESIFGGMTSIAPMFIIPGLTMSFARLKYRRARPIAVQVRLANYGFVFSLIGTAGLVAIQVSGNAKLPTMYPIYYAFSAAGFILYWLMHNAGTGAKIVSAFRSRLHLR